MNSVDTFAQRFESIIMFSKELIICTKNEQGAMFL